MGWLLAARCVRTYAGNVPQGGFKARTATKRKNGPHTLFHRKHHLNGVGIRHSALTALYTKTPASLVLAGVLYNNALQGKSR
jgi:hypothetical protein